MGLWDFFLCALLSSSFAVFLSAAASTAPPTTLIQLSAADNLTSSFNSTLQKSLNALPADPAVYHIPRSTQTLRLSNYSRRLPEIDVLACLLQAATSVIRELNSGFDRVIGENELQTSSNAVYLIVHPGSEMTWGMWGTTLQGLTDFVERWEPVDLDFEVMVSGIVGVVGSGLLVYV